MRKVGVNLTGRDCGMPESEKPRRVKPFSESTKHMITQRSYTSMSTPKAFSVDGLLSYPFVQLFACRCASNHCVNLDLGGNNLRVVHTLTFPLLRTRKLRKVARQQHPLDVAVYVLAAYAR